MTVEIVAILSNPSSTDITVEVTSNDTIATSKFTHTVADTKKFPFRLRCTQKLMRCVGVRFHSVLRLILLDKHSKKAFQLFLVR